ncbi:MAG: hypothetical protein ACYC2P_13480, partial [Paludibacteraceae bacterium]
GLSAFLLAKVLGGESTSGRFPGGMSASTTIALAASAGSVAAKLAHDYVLPHIPQDAKWITVESAGLNALASGGGAIGAVYLMDPAAARADSLPIAFYSVGGEMLGNYAYEKFIRPMYYH